MPNQEKAEIWVTKVVGVVLALLILFAIGMFGWSIYGWKRQGEPETRCLLTEKQKKERLLGRVYFCNMSTGELYGEQWGNSWYNETKEGWESKNRYWAGSGIAQEETEEMSEYLYRQAVKEALKDFGEKLAALEKSIKEVLSVYTKS